MSNRKAKHKARKAMFSNFFIWLVPGAILLGISVLIVAILIIGAAGDFTSSSDDPFKKWPKGIIGFLGIGYVLVAITSLLGFFYFDNLDAEGIIFLIAMTVVFSLLGYWAISYDYKRLVKKFS